MGKRITQEEFIEKAVSVHGDRYDYSLTKYVNKTQKVKIICKEHGTFEQVPHSHLKGFKCKKCATEIGRLKTSDSIEQFISKAIKVHGDFYNYEKSKYINAATHVEIKCPIHGSFMQTPNNHTQGKGCKSCGIQRAKEVRTKTNEEFKKEASKLHDNFYDYSKTNYLNWFEYITITCPKHGDFEQQAGVHLSKSGCTKCIQELDFRKRSHYISLAEKAIVYLVKMKSDSEVFYKIGKTINTTSKRFGGKRIPYRFETIHEHTDSIDKIYDLEIELHRLYKKYKYVPNKRFKGYTECYSMELPIQEIIDLKTS